MWDAHPADMQVALARHDVLLREAIEAANGYVFKTVGDAFCAAFATAADALEAAVAAQRAIGAAPWPSSTPIRVRMGLHSGTCEERDGDYFGSVVNRAARLEAIAHGGQTVLSGVTADLVRDSLPDGVALVDLGGHRLKDLGRPERVFQVCAPGLEGEFAPLRSLDNPALLHNLPAQVSTFVGRAREVAELRELVDASRLVTVTGAGGAGKTRLALQVAADLLDGSGDGVWFVDLAPLADPDLVAATIASVLGVREQSGRPLLETLLDALADQHCLLILDNCEHVIEAVAKTAHAILNACPHVHLLATSREPLGIGGEQTYGVPPMALPDVDADAFDLLARSEAVRLFVERAAQHKPGFELDTENAAGVAVLCRRLDGMPLAIELAAARVRSLSVGELTRRLDQRFRILTGGTRTAPPRQQTLRGLIDWSYNLLDHSEQTVLDRLSVFAGGFDLDAAEAVTSGESIELWEILDRVASLVEKSLVQADESDAATRYRLLETVREYAAERLAEHGADKTRRAHRDHYLSLAEVAEPELVASEQATWLHRLAVEHDNLRVAMAGCLTDADPEPGLRLGVALRWYWSIRGYAIEGCELLGELLGRDGSVDDRLRVRALIAYSGLLIDLGDYETAQRCADDAIRRLRDDDPLIVDALRTSATATFRRGDAARGLVLAEEGVARARSVGDAGLLARLLCAEGLVRAAGLEDWEGSRACNAEAFPLLRTSGDRRTLAAVLHNISTEELKSGDAPSAREHLAESLGIAEELGSDYLFMHGRLTLGFIDIIDSDYPAAREHLAQSLRLARRTGNQPLAAASVLGLAIVTTAEGEPRDAVILHGAADRLRENTGESLEPLDSRLRAADHEQLRETLGDALFDQEYATGHALSRADAVALAFEPPR